MPQNLGVFRGLPFLLAATLPGVYTVYVYGILISRKHPSSHVTKPVQLSDEAYRRLRARKKAGESFSDVVLRLTGRGTLSRLQGLRSADDSERAAQQIVAMDRLDKPTRRGRR